MKPFFLIAVLAFSFQSNAQPVLKPGEGIFDRKYFKNEKYEMACFAFSGKQMIEVSSFSVQVNVNAKTLSVYTTLHMYSANEKWMDTSIADAGTLKPLYRSSYNPNREFALRFGREVEGFYFDHQTKKRNLIQETLKDIFFDSYLYPYLLGSLPLGSGYKASMQVYDYKPSNNSNIKNTRIEEVKSGMYISEMTGEHEVWQVSVFEEATNEKYEYYLDKDNRKLWKIEILSANGQRFMLLDKELDYNPFTNKFNKEEALKLVKEGSATIEGVAFARDNENEGALKGIAVFNINKKQYAKMNTAVILIPYTPYFKEWVSLNERLRKKGRSVPLGKEAAECIKTTTVYDNEGHFEFTSLMPGEYLLYTEFGYVHTSTRTEIVGYTDTYINGMFHGSSANTETYKYGTNAVAGIKKVITIKKQGEKLSVKLKKTL